MATGSESFLNTGVEMKKSILAILLATAGIAHAEFIDGNALLKDLSSKSLVDQAFAAGYVAGAADSLQGSSFCIAGTATIKQTSDITKKFLEQFPEHRHATADVVVRAALKSAFPCKAKPAALLPQPIL